MPKRPKKRPEDLTFEPFFGKWAGDVRKAQEKEAHTGLTAPIIGMSEFSLEMWKEVEAWWPFQLLREAAKDGDIEGYKRLLCYFLGRLGVTPPKGVVSALRWPAGRPNETEVVYLRWINMGAPKLTWHEKDKLAKSLFPEEYTKAMSDEKLRKKLRDRVGAAVGRHAMKRPAVSSRD